MSEYAAALLCERVLAYRLLCVDRCELNDVRAGWSHAPFTPRHVRPDRTVAPASAAWIGCARRLAIVVDRQKVSSLNTSRATYRPTRTHCLVGSGGRCGLGLSVREWDWAVGCWRGYLSGARCRLAHSPADATATHCLVLQQNPDWFTLSGTGPPG